MRVPRDREYDTKADLPPQQPALTMGVGGGASFFQGDQTCDFVPGTVHAHFPRPRCQAHGFHVGGGGPIATQEAYLGGLGGTRGVHKLEELRDRLEDVSAFHQCAEDGTYNLAQALDLLEEVHAGMCIWQNVMSRASSDTVRLRTRPQKQKKPPKRQRNKHVPRPNRKQQKNDTAPKAKNNNNNDQEKTLRPNSNE